MAETKLSPQVVGRRIREEEIDDLFERQFSSNAPLMAFLVGRCFGSNRQPGRIGKFAKNVHVDHRATTRDPMLYGENDVEVVFELGAPNGPTRTAALLIENKIDARLMDQQGRRYRARGELRRAKGDWQEFRCAFVAPAGRIRQLYPLGDWEAAGWDAAFSFEELSDVLAAFGARNDAQLLLDATLKLNHFNEPIDTAVQFWKAYQAFGDREFPDAAVTVRTQAGSRTGGVWPSFFDGDFRLSPERWRRRFQIVHVDTAAQVVLFTKKVDPRIFRAAIADLVVPPMGLSKPGGSWQGTYLPVPPVIPAEPIDDQIAEVSSVFEGARQMHEFFLTNEASFAALVR